VFLEERERRELEFMVERVFMLCFKWREKAS
jgi:hypothetical protein